MFYVEFLRAVRGMRVILIILGLFVLAAIVVRVTFNTAIVTSGRGISADIASEEHQAGAKVTSKTLLSGVRVTTIDNPGRHSHDVITYNGDRVRMTQTLDAAHGPTTVTESGWVGVTGAYHPDVSIESLFVAAAVMGLLFATLLACSLTRENDGHLELAWTKPVSRVEYALGGFGVDIAGIIATEILTIVIALLLGLLFTPYRLTFGSDGGWLVIAVALLLPIAWHALLTAAGASLRSFGLIVGLGWPVALILLGVANIDAQPGTLGAGIVTAARAIDTINPLSYIGNGPHVHFSSGSAPTLFTLTPPIDVIALAVLFVIFLGASLLQWRRLEA